MATKTSSTTRGKSAAATRKRNAAQQRARRQIHAIILFAVGIFVAALTLVKGSSGWNWLHNAMFGLFGWGAIFVAVTLLYIAALLTMDKPFKARAFECGVLVVLFCGALQIFQMGLPESDHLLDMLVECILRGTEVKSGGLFGAIAGLPLLHFFGKVGAGVVIVLLIFVFLMLLTGGTLIGLARRGAPARQKDRGDLRRPDAEAGGAPRRPRPGRPEDAHRHSARHPAPGPQNREGRPRPHLRRAAGGRAAAPRPKAAAIDIPLDDDFDPALAGGFSLLPADEAMEFVPAPQPSIDDLVSKAATDTGRFSFKAEPAPEPEPAPPFEPDPVPSPPLDRGKPDEGIQMELEAESTIPVHPAYVKPHVGLLKEPRRKSETDITDEMRANAQRLVDTLGLLRRADAHRGHLPGPGGHAV